MGWRDVEPGWTFACVCCHRKRFNSQVAVYNPEEIIKKVGESIINDAIGDLDPEMMTNGQHHLCHYCRSRILKDQVPPMSNKKNYNNHTNTTTTTNNNNNIN